MLDMLDGLLTWTARSEHQEVWAGPSWSSYALQVRSLLLTWVPSKSALWHAYSSPTAHDRIVVTLPSCPCCSTCADAAVQQACSLGTAAHSSTPTLVQRLRASGDHLQHQLDHWDAVVLRRWFVNADSAREHEQSGLQQGQRH
jgi:hypothetical protein